MLTFSVCGVRQNFYVFSFYRNRIFHCLLTPIAAVQAGDVNASFLFVSDLNPIIRSGWVLRPRIVTVMPRTYVLLRNGVYKYAQFVHIVIPDVMYFNN